jgi:hypothetical protein
VTLTGIKAGNWPVIVTAYNDNGPSPDGTTSVTVANVAPGTPAPPVVKPAPPAADPVPHVPTQAHATHVTDGGVATIKWTAPKAIGGAPVLHYIVSVDGRRKIAGAHATSVKVKGLRAGPAVIRVQAVNENGISKATVTKFVVSKADAQEAKGTLKLGMDGSRRQASADRPRHGAPQRQLWFGHPPRARDVAAEPRPRRDRRSQRQDALPARCLSKPPAAQHR